MTRTVRHADRASPAGRGVPGHGKGEFEVRRGARSPVRGQRRTPCGCGSRTVARPTGGRSRRRCRGGRGRAGERLRRSCGRTRSYGKRDGLGGGRSSRPWEIDSFEYQGARMGLRDAGGAGSAVPQGLPAQSPAHDRHSLDRARRSAPTKLSEERAPVSTITRTSYYLRRCTGSHGAELRFRRGAQLPDRVRIEGLPGRPPPGPGGNTAKGAAVAHAVIVHTTDPPRGLWHRVPAQGTVRS